MTRFNLPVFGHAAPTTPAELLRLALHAEEIYQRTLTEGEGASFEFGLAMMAQEFDRLAEANRMWGVTMVPGIPPDEMARRVDEVYTERNLKCHGWHFADARVPADLRSVLEAKGYRLKRSHLWAMRQPRNLALRQGLMVIPGRASQKGLADLNETAERAWGTTDAAELAQQREAIVRHLDDPRVENLLAFDNGIPVGTGFLVTAGEIGLIIELFVHPAHVRQGIATGLLTGLVDLAARSRLKQLALFCDADNAAGRALYTATGFIETAECEWMELSR